VQIVPVFSGLTEEAVREAETADLDGMPVRVVTARHLAVIALSVGRAKDMTRILTLLESGSVNADTIDVLAAKHALTAKWTAFRKRFLDE
jgi:hypothetical protein